MLTEQERAFLDALAKAPIPTDVMGLRAAMETFIPMMNSNLPEIGSFHEAVELRPGLTADVAVPKGNGPHPVVVLEDMPHGFLQMDVLSGSKQGLDKMFDFLRRTI